MSSLQTDSADVKPNGESNANGDYSEPRKRERVAIELMIDASRSDRAIAKEIGVSNRTVSCMRKRLEKDGEIWPRLKSTHSAEACLHDVCTSLLREAPENAKVYDGIRDDDPAIVRLSEDIRENGLHHRIGVSRDGVIGDGHRRFRAVKRLGWEKVPVYIRRDISYAKDREKFLRWLTGCNEQRVKSTEEVLREGLLGMDGHAWQRVCDYRQEAAEVNGVEVIHLRGEKRRSQIQDKLGLKNAIVACVNANAKYWPIGDRKVFYDLLNVPGLLRNDRLKTPFENSQECYDDITDMVTRMRLDGTIPFESIEDETRPVVIWDTHKSVGTFIRRELEDLFSGYWRDLLQSQTNWVELLVEKNTVASSLKSIAAKYTLPMTSGRGYSSLPPRKAMVDRFRQSGREKLVLIVVADFDPEGEDIPNSFGLSLRDDFHLSSRELRVVKAALTHKQVRTLSLHEGQFAKKDSKRYKRFVQAYGNRCWELEAVPIETLRAIVETTVRKVLNVEAFEAELAK
jgi:hypothetical protein